MPPRISSALETVDRFDIGLLLAGLSSPAFFSSRSTCADLKRLGNLPDCSDRLVSLVMAGAKPSAQSFSSEAGRTSIGDVLRGIEVSSFQTSSIDSIVTGGNADNSGPVIPYFVCLL